MPAPGCQLLCSTTVLFKGLYCKIKNGVFIFCVCFSCIICEKYYKPITAQYYLASCVSWVPTLTLLDLRTRSRNGTRPCVGDLLYYSQQQPQHQAQVWLNKSVHEKRPTGSNSVQKGAGGGDPAVWAAPTHPLSGNRPTPSLLPAVSCHGRRGDQPQPGRGGASKPVLSS